jgi:hypothetical protein
VLGALPLSAQYFNQSNYWKTHRGELVFGFALSNFLGELGGRDQIGSPFIWDLEISQTKPGATFGYRYFLTEKMALRTNFTYAILSGNDNLTNEPFRQNRNISFKSDLFELSLLYEFHLYKEELGHLYDLRGVKGVKSSRVGLYFFTGIVGFHFDPRAQFENRWVRLKPLRTEGQGLEGGPDEYSNFSWGIPIGVGVRKSLSKQFSIGAEFRYVKTFTDYIDDVSGVYYDNDAIASNFGPIAAYFADPSLGLIPGQTNPGEMRGNSEDLDAYLLFTVNMNYKLFKYRSSTKKYRSRIRRQKIVF